MSLVMDTLRTSMITEELNDAEMGILEGLFDVQGYKAGEVIIQPGDKQPDNLNILAHGEIQVIWPASLRLWAGHLPISARPNARSATPKY